MTRRKPITTILVTVLQRTLALVAGCTLAFGIFMLLPVLERITSGNRADLVVQEMNTANVPPPPAPPIEEEEEKEPDPPPEAEPPKLADEAPPLDLSMLELALNPGTGGAGFGGDFAVKLPVGASAGGSGDGSDVDALFSLSELDQKPRAIYQPSPQSSPQLRKIAPGTVYIVFVVDQRGRVENPTVQSSSDPAFEGPALAAVKQWKFEPGKRNGEPVRFRMRVPITFPKGK